MSAIGRLLESDPFDFSEANKALFVESVRECARAHYDGCGAFRAFWDDENIVPEAIQSEMDLSRLPPIIVSLFKEREWRSVRDDQVALVLTSSGTSGQKSQMILDQGSLDRVKRLAWKIHQGLGITSGRKVNYLCFTYDPAIAKDLGTAFTDELLTSFTGRNEVFYALQWDARKKDFFLNSEAVIETLKRYEKGDCPVRILGFPAHLYLILRDSGLRLKLPEDSWVQTGGGWKGLAEEEIPKSHFRQFVSERLGIPESNIRDMFGMVEHGIPYVDCDKGRMHVPNYSRVFIRSPFDLSIQPEGAPGLMHLICTYNTSYPMMSLLTTDYARLGRCDCGLPGQTLEILGRAGVSKHKGCAFHAAALEVRHVPLG